MIKAVIVGDEPSPTNIHSDIAFVGAKCFERLVSWIKQLPIDYYICVNSVTESDFKKIDALTKAEFKVIALGSAVSRRLSALGIGHFMLPHPSGLNRKLNDPKFVALELFFCSTYLLGIDGQD